MQLSRGHMVYKLYNVAENCIFPTQKGAQWAWAFLLNFVVENFCHIVRGLSEKSENVTFPCDRKVLCFPCIFILSQAEEDTVIWETWVSLALLLYCTVHHLRLPTNRKKAVAEDRSYLKDLDRWWSRWLRPSWWPWWPSSPWLRPGGSGGTLMSVRRSLLLIRNVWKRE